MYFSFGSLSSFVIGADDCPVYPYPDLKNKFNSVVRLHLVSVSWKSTPIDSRSDSNLDVIERYPGMKLSIKENAQKAATEVFRVTKIVFCPAPASIVENSFDTWRRLTKYLW